ncbi:UNVERIFIED_CONTAM: VAN3-binding protein [Sesamum radiatum]|uniref:VAN3-binding protein n=1 Tax=Sesamum radiatum TaxID=300843 RepID=A0AAW2NB61_SESRA
MALTKIDPDYRSTLSQAHPETMDFLSNAWCNFAVQAFQPEAQEQSLVLQDNSIKLFEHDTTSVYEDGQERKDGSRRQVCASLESQRCKAALVAAQCAKVAEAMGAKREQLSSVISSAISGTSADEIVTLTAAAATSIRGADTLKARSGYKNRLNGSSPVLPLEDNNELDFNFEQCRSILAKGADLNMETTDGRFLLRSVAVILNNEGKVVLKMKKLNMLNALARQKESFVLDMHAELYKDSEAGEMETGYLIVLTTDKGMIKLDMMNDYQRHRTWSMTINHMLMLSTTFTKYELQFYKG